jgi:hypothetical protein
MTEQQFNYLKGLNRQYSQNALENPTLKQFWNRKIAENHKKLAKKGITKDELKADLISSGFEAEKIWFSEKIGPIIPAKIDIHILDDENIAVMPAEEAY